MNSSSSSSFVLRRKRKPNSLFPLDHPNFSPFRSFDLRRTVARRRCGVLSSERFAFKIIRHTHLIGGEKREKEMKNERQNWVFSRKILFVRKKSETKDKNHIESISERERENRWKITGFSTTIRRRVKTAEHVSLAWMTRFRSMRVVI